MPDMLAPLYNLPDARENVERLLRDGITIRRIQPYEVSNLRRFVLDNFTEPWADEVMSAFSHQPITCFVATFEKKIIGFAGYECTRRGFFGPTGVKEEFRGRGIGRALLLAPLHAMYELGYAYAVIGGVGPSDFYSKTVSAITIPHSTPGIYTDRLEE